MAAQPPAYTTMKWVAHPSRLFAKGGWQTDRTLGFAFYDFNVWTERKRIEKLRYMHRNPVKRGLVASPELWNWISLQAYAPGEAGPVKVNEWEVLKMKIRLPAA